MSTSARLCVISSSCQRRHSDRSRSVPQRGWVAGSWPRADSPGDRSDFWAAFMDILRTGSLAPAIVPRLPRDVWRRLAVVIRTALPHRASSSRRGLVEPLVLGNGNEDWGVSDFERRGRTLLQAPWQGKTKTPRGAVRQKADPAPAGVHSCRIRGKRGAGAVLSRKSGHLPLLRHRATSADRIWRGPRGGRLWTGGNRRWQPPRVEHNRDGREAVG